VGHVGDGSTRIASKGGRNHRTDWGGQWYDDDDDENEEEEEEG